MTSCPTAVQVTAMSYVNGLGLDLKRQAQEQQEHLHLEDFKFADLKWAKSSRMSKRWILFSLRIKARFSLPTAQPSMPQCLHQCLCFRMHSFHAPHRRQGPAAGRIRAERRRARSCTERGADAAWGVA
jgi:hypothetical protein